MELVIQKPYAKDNQNTGNCADHDGTKSIYQHHRPAVMATRPAREAFKTHRNIRLAIFYPGQDHGNNGCNGGGDGCSNKDGAELFNGGCSSTVETVPAKPQNENIQVHQWEGYVRGMRLPLLLCLPYPLQTYRYGDQALLHRSER